MPPNLQDPGDGAGEPPWLPTLGHWFIASAILLLLPRQWIPAGISMALGITLSLVARHRASRP